MALGEGCLISSVVVKVLSGFVAFVHLKKYIYIKKAKKEKQGQGHGQLGPFGFGLWGLARSGFGSFGRSVSLPDRASIPRNIKDPTRGLGRPEPRALGLALFFS